MARPHVRLAMLLVLSMLMVGCTSSATPEWGNGDGEFNVDIDEDDKIATIESQLGNGYDGEVELACEAKEVTITGMLISSQIYDSHPDLAEGDVNSAMGAAVIIDIMKWSEAESVEEGSAERVSIKDWTSPTNPEEGGGSKKIKENEEEWAVIGIIPASENIADGLNILEHWHQPIELTGYIVITDGIGKVADCTMDGQGHGMIVTNIETEQGVVSLDGEDDDEYSLGDTDFFGRWTFILFFLIVGVGGGVGLFMVSTMVIRQGARATAEALLGREGFAKALQMKKDLRSSKKAGLESASDRAAKQRRDSPPPEKQATEEVAISGFSLDSVLSSSEDEGPTKFGNGGSVIVTSESEQIHSQPVVTSAPVKVDSSSMPPSNVISSRPEPAKRGHFSASMSSSQISSKPSSEDPVKGKPVKRRAVKKRAIKSAPEPEPEVREARTSISDDDEFSDFSF
tara:strand:+ start:145 stop:1512 length:1368 start_codon:yes stop_codon:yes gene_type:complete